MANKKKSVEKTAINTQTDNSSNNNLIWIIIAGIILLVLLVAVFYPAMTGNATYKLTRKTTTPITPIETTQPPPTTEPSTPEAPIPSSTTEPITETKKIIVPSKEKTIDVGTINLAENTNLYISKTFLFGLIKIQLINLEIDENNLNIAYSTDTTKINFYNNNEFINSAFFPQQVTGSTPIPSEANEVLIVLGGGQNIRFNLQAGPDIAGSDSEQF